MVMSWPAAEASRGPLPALWRAIEDAHYSYLETEDSPDKLRQKARLEGFITEYLSVAPPECRFRLPETARVFQRTVAESDFNAYRAGLGWAALARYAANLLAQPWRPEYRTIRLYCGYYKHEVEANIVGAETLLQVMGYRAAGPGKLQLSAPLCPDTVTAVSRDALIAQCECKIMGAIWERVWGLGGRVSWAAVWGARRRLARPPDAVALLAADTAATAADPAATVAATLSAPESEIYYNVSVPDAVPPEHSQLPAPIAVDSHGVYDNVDNVYHEESTMEEPIVVQQQPYMVPNVIPPNMMYPDMSMQQPCNVPVMAQYPVPYYYHQPHIQTPYMMPTPVYPTIKHATNIPINGYAPQYRYPTVPTAQLIELDAPICENGRYQNREDERITKRREADSSRRNSTSKSGFSDVSLPSLPRSDTQPALSKAREDGMGTYESWDYVFRNLSNKEQDRDKSRLSPSLDRDSRTLDRLEKDERRKYHPTTLDLEDGMQAMNLDRSNDEDAYRTARVNENLMRLKQEQETKRARHLAKKQLSEERKRKPLEPLANPVAEGLVSSKVPSDKVKLLTKKDVKEKKEIMRQQSSVNGSSSNAEVRRVKSSVKASSVESDKPRSKHTENGHSSSHSSKISSSSSLHQPQNSYDLKAHLVVSLDETDAVRRSPPKHNGDTHKPSEVANRGDTTQKWECGTCTYINKASLQACEMCGKSKKALSEIQPLTSGGRECPTCTLVNKREAKVCDACGSGLEHCPTYI